MRTELGLHTHRTDNHTEDCTNWSWYEYIREQLDARPHPFDYTQHKMLKEELDEDM